MNNVLLFYLENHFRNCKAVFEKTRFSLHEERWRIYEDIIPSEVSLVLREKLKTSVGKPVSGRSAICKIDVVEPQTLQTSVDKNKS